ncbi:MAG: hypothetical protein ACXW2G_13690 [Burkholderiaceae bacterium]
MAASWTPWSRTLQRAAVSGTVASVLSTLTLAALGWRESDAALGPINAVSHWYWGRKAMRQDDASLRYTVPGYLTHHGASIFWAVIFERLFARRARRDPATALATGATVATLAATVDYTITPKRLTPGYEARLSIPSLVIVYAAFGAGLALTEMTRGWRR